MSCMCSTLIHSCGGGTRCMVSQASVHKRQPSQRARSMTMTQRWGSGSGAGAGVGAPPSIGCPSVPISWPKVSASAAKAGNGRPASLAASVTARLRTPRTWFLSAVAVVAAAPAAAPNLRNRRRDNRSSDAIPLLLALCALVLAESRLERDELGPTIVSHEFPHLRWDDQHLLVIFRV